MLNVILGSVLGGLVAGALALGASTVANRAPEEATASTRPVSVAAPAIDIASEPPTVVECGLDERAELRRRWIAGREVAHVACVPAGVRTSGGPDIVAPAPVLAPAAFVSPAVTPERVVVRAAPRPRSNKRSWTKSTLIIGGSAGAGAGVGGLVGGKKGALIGAALGGGSAAIYEAAKRSQ